LLLILNLDFLDLRCGFKKFCFICGGFDSPVVARKSLVCSRSVLAVVDINVSSEPVNPSRLYVVDGLSFVACSSIWTSIGLIWPKRALWLADVLGIC